MVVRDVLQDMVAQDDIKGVVFKGKGADIRFNISKGRVEIGSRIIQVAKLSESFVKGLFRCEMQKFSLFAEKTCFVF